MYDNQVLCCAITLISCFVGLNSIEIAITISQMIHAYSALTGSAFDCSFYPLTLQLTCISFIAATALTFLVTTTAMMCIKETAESTIEHCMLISLYIIYGPCMFMSCFYFLLFFEDYGYSCGKFGERQYNQSLKVAYAILCLVGAVITVISGAKAAIKKVTNALRDDSNWYTMLINTMVNAPRVSASDEERVDEREEYNEKEEGEHSSSLKIKLVSNSCGNSQL